MLDAVAEPGNDPIETAWAELLGSWEDDAAHKRFIGLASGLGRLADAGRKYREARDAPDSSADLGALPKRREIAEKRIGEILGIAVVTMAAHKTAPPEKNHPKLLFVATGVCLAMILFAVWAFLKS